MAAAKYSTSPFNSKDSMGPWTANDRYLAGNNIIAAERREASAIPPTGDAQR